VKKVTEMLIAKGRVDRSWIGIHAQPLQELEQFFGADSDKGVLVASVDAGSPAEIAGIDAGDIILRYSGVDVSARFEEELPDFYQLIASSPSDKEVDIVVWSNGAQLHRKITPRLLGELQGNDFDFEKWSFTARAITHQMAIDERLSDTMGIFVTQAVAPGPAFNGGLRSGDIIKEVNRQTVNSLAQLKQVYESLRDEQKILLTVSRRNNIRYALLKLDKDREKEEMYNE